MTTPAEAYGVPAGTRVFVGHSGDYVLVETLKPGDWVLGWRLARPARGKTRLAYNCYPTEVTAVACSTGPLLELGLLSGRFARCGVNCRWHDYGKQVQDLAQVDYATPYRGLELGLIFKPNLQVDHDTYMPGARGDLLAGLQTTMFDEQLYCLRTVAGNCVLEGYAAYAGF